MLVKEDKDPFNCRILLIVFHYPIDVTRLSKMFLYYLVHQYSYQRSSYQ